MTIVQTSKDLDPRCSLWNISLTYLRNIYEWEIGSRGKHIFLTTFMKRIQIFNQCCVLVILMQEIYPDEKGN